MIYWNRHALHRSRDAIWDVSWCGFQAKNRLKTKFIQKKLWKCQKYDLEHLSKSFCEFHFLKEKVLETPFSVFLTLFWNIIKFITFYFFGTKTQVPIKLGRSSMEITSSSPGRTLKSDWFIGIVFLWGYWCTNKTLSLIGGYHLNTRYKEFWVILRVSAITI